MLAWGRTSAISLLTALILSTGAAAQAPAQTPTARELATRFVRDPSNTTMLSEAKEQMLAAVMEKGKDLPLPVRSWMATALPSAAEQVMRDMLPLMEERLIEAYSEKFTAAELQQILDFQVFVRQPHIAQAITDAAAPTAVARMQMIQAKLSAAEFERLMTETTKHPMLTMTMETLTIAEEITGEFVQRFNVVLQQHCATAPRGFPLCEDQGRAL